jgi:hypothetical protein
MRPLLPLGIPLFLSCAPKQNLVETVQIAVEQSSPTVPQQVADYLLHEGLAGGDCYGITLDTSQGNVTIYYTPEKKEKKTEDLFTLLYFLKAIPVTDKSPVVESPMAVETFAVDLYFDVYFDYGIDGTLDYLIKSEGKPTSFDALDAVEQLKHATRYQQTLLDMVAYIQQGKQ